MFSMSKMINEPLNLFPMKPMSTGIYLLNYWADKNENYLDIIFLILYYSGCVHNHNNFLPVIIACHTLFKLYNVAYDVE